MHSLFSLTNVVRSCPNVVHKGSSEKYPFSYPVSAFVHMWFTLPRLQTSALSIIRFSMVWQRNSWCSKYALLVDLIITDYFVCCEKGSCVFVHLLHNTHPCRRCQICCSRDLLCTAAVYYSSCCSLLNLWLQGIISLALAALLHGQSGQFISSQGLYYVCIEKVFNTNRGS